MSLMGTIPSAGASDDASPAVFAAVGIDPRRSLAGQSVIVSIQWAMIAGAPVGPLARPGVSASIHSFVSHGTAGI